MCWRNLTKVSLVMRMRALTQHRQEKAKSEFIQSNLNWQSSKCVFRFIGQESVAETAKQTSMRLKCLLSICNNAPRITMPMHSRNSAIAPTAVSYKIVFSNHANQCYCWRAPKFCAIEILSNCCLQALEKGEGSRCEWMTTSIPSTNYDIFSLESQKFPRPLLLQNFSSCSTCWVRHEKFLISVGHPESVSNRASACFWSRFQCELQKSFDADCDI